MKRERFDPTSFAAHMAAPVLDVEEVVEGARYRKEHRTDLTVDRVSELGIRWLDADPSHSSSGFYAKIDGKDMRLSRQAVRTASRMVKVKDLKYWDQFPDRNAFPMTLAHILENPAMSGSRKRSKQLLVRHNGLEVNAILPIGYKVLDAADLLTAMIDMMKDNVGSIKGISVLGDNNGDQLSYRFIVSENIMPSIRSEFGQHMMFLLATSETDAMPTETALGLFRTVCINSALRERSRMVWGHRGGLDNFMEYTGRTIRMAGYFQQEYSRIFGELLNTKLELPASDLLQAMRHEGVISRQHFEACEPSVNSLTEDHRPIETHYDMFNLLTAGARQLPEMQARHAAETRSMQLFTGAGGVLGQIQQVAMKQHRNRMLHNDAVN